jgi:thymidylate synthase (FAD)
MSSVTILPTTTTFPITLIGKRAGVCWGGDVTNPTKNYKRGLSCIKSGHGRTLEFVNVEMILDGYSARVIREWYTHIGGAPTRLQASTRYIDYGKFEYVVPDSIKSSSCRMAAYEAAMRSISAAYKVLQDDGAPKEDIALLLPLGMTTRVVDKRNLRNLVDMSHQRMCTRAYHEYRSMFQDIANALKEISEEWKTVVDMLFVPKCATLGYCPEEKGCGLFPKAENWGKGNEKT